MKIPFESHTIYITLDDEKIYQLNPDYSKIEVNMKTVLTEERLLNGSSQPFMVIHKEQFQHGKSHLFSSENPNRISKETAELYYKMEFISKDELDSYFEVLNNRFR